MLAAGAATLLLGGCAADAGGAAQPAEDITISAEEHAALVQAADLDPCPSPRGTAATSPAPSGERLPDLTLPCLGEGPEVTLSALGGVPYLVVIWGAWCEPCRDEMPFIEQAYADAGGRFGVLGVDIGDPHGKGLAWADAVGISFPSLEDEAITSRAALEYQAPPWTFLVAADGTVVGEHIGGFDSDAEVDAALARLGVTR